MAYLTVYIIAAILTVYPTRSALAGLECTVRQEINQLTELNLGSENSCGSRELEHAILPKPIRKLPTIVTPTLFVTHTTTTYDGDEVAKSGADFVINEFKSRGLPVVYLTDLPDVTQPNEESVAYVSRHWYTRDRKPTYVISGIEFDSPITADQVTIIGGFFGNCHLATVSSAIKNYRGSFPLSIHFPMKAIYDIPKWSPAQAPTVTLDRFLAHYHGNRKKFAEDAWEKLKPLTLECDLCSHLSLSEYQFILLIDGQSVKTVGTGKKLIQLYFE